MVDQVLQDVRGLQDDVYGGAVGGASLVAELGQHIFRLVAEGGDVGELQQGGVSLDGMKGAEDIPDLLLVGGIFFQFQETLFYTVKMLTGLDDEVFHQLAD